MPKILTTYQRQKIAEKVTKAEGEHCLFCWAEKGIKAGPHFKETRKLVLEHADNDQTNWTLGVNGNIHWACYSCNKKREKMPVKDKIASTTLYSDQLYRERKSFFVPTWDDVLQDDINYEGASTEIQLNRRYYREWLRYCFTRLLDDGSVLKKSLILAAAKRAGCSKQTSTNYLEVETSDEGPFIETRDGNGNPVIKLRNPCT